MSLPFLSWILAPCFIGLWSICNKALILLSWAFIRMHLGISNPLSQTWAYNVFITFGLFIFIHYFIIFFSWNSPLARILCSLSLKVYEILIILGLGMQQRDPRLGKFILALKDVGCQVYSIFVTFGPKSSFSKGIFPLGLMIAIRLWSYEPLKLKYTFGFRDKPLIGEDFFSFIPQHLRVYHNFKAIPSIFIPFICPLKLGEHMVYVWTNKRKWYPLW